MRERFTKRTERPGPGLVPKKQFILCLALLLAPLYTVLAQQQISGKVVTATDGTGLPGVNVTVKGTTTGTTTGEDGTYRLSLNQGSNAVLVFSFVGYTSEEVVVGNQSVINVTLAEDINTLREVVDLLRWVLNAKRPRWATRHNQSAAKRLQRLAK